VNGRVGDYWQTREFNNRKALKYLSKKKKGIEIIFMHSSEIIGFCHYMSNGLLMKHIHKPTSILFFLLSYNCFLKKKLVPALWVAFIA
jgi:hypothetical protein